ncbi:uncharacterized protein K460DRAFT_315934 [Cucurbitaria berberidis CBS 394.84]|uniref:Uncharacterized protein n=1 Tax=Cucurbitaria berberidis CBS 394.84 TaxID=1168544 RepID=A0A9P4GDH3_9PLEO|nr:uncharacterized protein K460DRAFT_315934 [Cucurbitaria berberidis CBS 394.84]KAF1843511.1 hypothetical protein K460DRAFT_315934 [Cucurbitaria berberidis CBS 394.84]
MAHDQATSMFMGLPLEVRHHIFELAAARDFKPKKLLRYWFEKKEVEELIAKQAAANSNGPIPRVVHSNEDYEQDSEVADENAEDQDQDQDDEDEEEDDEANEEQDSEPADEEDDEGMDQDGEEQLAEVDTQDEMEGMDAGQGTQIPASAHVQTQAAAHGEDDPEQSEADIEDGIEEGLAEEGEGETEDQGTQNDGDEDGDQAMADDDGEGEAGEDENDEQDTSITAPPPPARVPMVRAQRKWRYIPKFMRLTHCPPPIELLLTSKQLNDEAKDWYYDVAVLRIEATGSFAHTSFYEEAFSQITEAAFSPMENIRKVEVTFVWDTTWIRADTTGCVAAIFPALLRQRATFVYQILKQAPDLKEVVIHWHDSAQDSESANLRIDVLGPFDNLPATVQIVKHYIPADSKPYKRSIAGKQRVEFQKILDMGLDRLF